MERAQTGDIQESRIEATVIRLHQGHEARFKRPDSQL